MNIYDLKNANTVKAIKFCLNWDPKIMKLYSVKYSIDKEIYKVSVLDYNWGGRTTCRLTEKFVRSSRNWLNAGGSFFWDKDFTNEDQKKE